MPGAEHVAVERGGRDAVVEQLVERGTSADVVLPEPGSPVSHTVMPAMRARPTCTHDATCVARAIGDHRVLGE